jgi:hypothetical protein
MRPAMQLLAIGRVWRGWSSVSALLDGATLGESDQTRWLWENALVQAYPTK